jgi:hypothetical protein
MSTNHIGKPPGTLPTNTAYPKGASTIRAERWHVFFVFMLHGFPKKYRGNTKTKTHDTPFCPNERSTLGKGSFGGQQTPGALPI